MKLAVGSDHAGFALKEAVKLELERRGHEVVDVGTSSGTESVDYPDYAIPVAEMVARHDVDAGVVVCATGIGASIAANKVRGARASVVTSEATARLTRQDNDSNILALGGKTVPSFADALLWLRVWLDTPFAGGRHERRVDKIRQYEDQHQRP